MINMENPGLEFPLERVPGTVVGIPQAGSSAYRNRLVYIVWPNGRTDAAHRSSVLSKSQLSLHRQSEPPTNVAKFI